MIDDPKSTIGDGTSSGVGLIVESIDPVSEFLMPPSGWLKTGLVRLRRLVLLKHLLAVFRKERGED
jgi:hypothetical protein